MVGIAIASFVIYIFGNISSSVQAISTEDQMKAIGNEVADAIIKTSKNINTTIIKTLIKDDYIPVVYPIGVDSKGQGYNINADTAAASIAIALRAEKLTILTDVDGVFERSELVQSLTTEEIDNKIRDNIITGGMIPKVDACKYAVIKGCKKAHLINGTISHALLLEIFTDKGVGTEIVK